MKRILITGATGNAGFETIRFLSENNSSNKIIAGVRNIERAKNKFSGFPDIQFAEFDFEDENTFDEALKNIDTIFLLRPPHISDVKKYFAPLIEKMKAKQVSEIVFLSVQEAEKSTIIPHNKIERLIAESGLSHIFLRPGYFMQNLTTTLLNDIQNKQEIILPAGKAKFNWVDVNNIGEVAALLLLQFERYKNQAIELTGCENADFYKVVNLLNETAGTEIRYRSVNPLKFYSIKRKEGMKPGMIMVMTLLHFVRRFQKEPRISGFYERLTGKEPTTLKEFFEREEILFRGR
ncbi:MAG TPA: NmrA family NAD(P)-binding protein [Tangfeifania sp.]|nr:NmrA family NAD(P)-binding protein [Tangfeifania sp.]